MSGLDRTGSGNSEGPPEIPLGLKVVPIQVRPAGRRLLPERSLLGPVAVVLVLVGAALLVWSAVLHLYLYGDYFHKVGTIGALFIAQGAAGNSIAVALLGFRKAAFALAGSLLLASTAGALLFSVWFGLFGYRERFSAPYTSESLGVELAGAAVLAGAALLLRRHRGRSGRWRSGSGTCQPARHRPARHQPADQAP